MEKDLFASQSKPNAQREGFPDVGQEEQEAQQGYEEEESYQAMQEKLLASFAGKVKPVGTPFRYQVSLFFTALAMVLLPLLYFAMIGALGFGLLLYVQYVPLPNPEDTSSSIMFLYFTPLIAGGVFVAFMIKAMFPGHRPSRDSQTLKPEDEPLFFAFVEKVCESVGAPVPYRIEISHGANASASFCPGLWNKLRRRMVLSVGLTLVGGLNLRQFTGVLAHEFGHFSQGFGMHFVLLIGSINDWLHRAARGDDAWNASLAKARETEHFLVNVPAFLVSLFLFLARGILYLLALLGEWISSSMMRQMEFDADRYCARLVGASQVEPTLRKAQQLGFAESMVHELLSETQREGALSEDLVAHIIAQHAQLPAELLEACDALLAEETTGLFDSHPCFQERVRNVAQETSSGSFQNEEPATLLFRAFPDLCRESTLLLYREAFGEAMAQKNLAPAEELLQYQSERQEEQAASERFFQGLILTTSALPWFQSELQPPKGQDSTIRTLEKYRRERQELLPQARLAFGSYCEADEEIDQARCSLAIRKVDLAPKASSANKRPPDAQTQRLKIALRKAKETRKEKEKVLRAFEEVAKKHLRLALRALHLPSVQEERAEAKVWLQESETLLFSLQSLSKHYPKVHTLYRHHCVLVALLSHLEECSNEAALYERLNKEVEGVHLLLGELWEPLASLPYPFSQEVPSTAEFIFGDSRAEDLEDLGELIRASVQLFEGVWGLHQRILGRLSVIAEQAETVLALAFPTYQSLVEEALLLDTTAA